MNCKQGELAIIVVSTIGNEGKIVRCIRPYHGRFISAEGEAIDRGASWVIEPHLDGFGNNRAWAAPDAWLRPIRDPGEDATDETLIYAGKPQREIA